MFRIRVDIKVQRGLVDQTGPGTRKKKRPQSMIWLRLQILETDAHTKSPKGHRGPDIKLSRFQSKRQRSIQIRYSCPQQRGLEFIEYEVSLPSIIKPSKLFHGSRYHHEQELRRVKKVGRKTIQMMPKVLKSETESLLIKFTSKFPLPYHLISPIFASATK